MIQRILKTDGVGFVGSHLCDRLLKGGLKETVHSLHTLLRK
jgi:uncharacterized protein YbjT (DUF2867 family)